MQVRKLIQHWAPEVHVVGDEYPPPPNKKLAASIAQVVQFALIVFVFMGESLFAWMGTATPDWFKRLSDSKMMAVLAIWFIGGQVISGLISTGAFEIYVNDELAFSRLRSGTMPD
mmetsp:Transcript_14853/g.10752  ORF Transcript_14853/g.10752 Transcript_14853/m.10752 type:complete len:115 (-) Transcript_14853:179-523(-)